MVKAVDLINEKRANCAKFARELVAAYNLNERTLGGQLVPHWVGAIEAMSAEAIIGLVVQHLGKYRGNEGFLVDTAVRELQLSQLSDEHRGRLVRYLQFFIEVVQES